MTTQKKLALVTGASSGIGAELARIHAEHGGDLVVVARRRERLDSLKAELEAAHGVTVHVLPKDLARPQAPQEIYDEVRTLGVTIDYLVNNAGFGYRGFFHKLDWAINEAMIQVNILALAALTRLFVPHMVARHSGRILNLGSMAGFMPGPLHAVYYASKAFVISFSEAIANELRHTGVTVTVLCPGPTQSEFTQVAQMSDVNLTRTLASTRQVAEAGYDAMLRGKPVLVPGLANKITVHGLLRLSPRRVSTRISRILMEKRERK
ncbi:MAG: SDR family oxidoreductase [Planctomycetes bacterium]|nr:SDR family oxidoreductase [Planctomycetota bacterium]